MQDEGEVQGAQAAELEKLDLYLKVKWALGKGATKSRAHDGSGDSHYAANA